MTTRLVLAVLVALLVGCGNVSTPPTTTPRPSPTPSTTSTTSPSEAALVEDAFVRTLARGGVIGKGSDVANVQLGRTVCTNIDNGSAGDVAVYSLRVHNGWSAGDAGFFVGAAVAAFCPEHLGTVS